MAPTEFALLPLLLVCLSRMWFVNYEKVNDDVILDEKSYTL